MVGTGFLQVAQIFAYLLHFKPKLLLIDEPDSHLHPGTQERLKYGGTASGRGCAASSAAPG